MVASAAAKNALAVRKMSLALRNSVTSRRRAFNSSDSESVTGAGPAPASSALVTQFRSVAGLMSSSAPTCRRAPAIESPCSRIRSWYILTARARVSSSNFRGAAMADSLPCNIRSLQPVQDGSGLTPLCGSHVLPYGEVELERTAAVAALLRHAAHGSRRRNRRTAWRDPLAAHPNQPVNDSGPKRPQATKAAAAR